MTWCFRSMLTEFGELAVRWTQDSLEVVVPCNTTATVHWRWKKHEVGGGCHHF
ncbi:alpha-L-rhamnosidase C-terminal domain-containing protein [Nocardia xishanensis]|uniref:Alpha-L-rhamnosidase C-terminal domain-containing protein n=1 Tax=Nocardia xishanensis TaxID=238964 RepID=A0ABW7XB94_9NOCA